MNAAKRLFPRFTTPVLATASLLATASAAAQSASWTDYRADPARTGTVNLALSTREPRVAWRLTRAGLGVALDATGSTLAEIDLDGRGSTELVSITDRSIAAWDGATGRQLWPEGNGEYFPLQNIAGVADLNGDGTTDIIAVGRDNLVAVYDARGARRWSLPLSRNTTSFAGMVRVVDMSGTDTSRQLLVVRTDGTDTMRISLFSFDAAFAATELRSASITGDGEQASTRTQVGDFDGDSLPDVMTLRNTSMGFTTAFIRGNGVAAGSTWTVASRSFAAPMGGCVPRGGTTWRTQTFAAPDRDLLAFKQSTLTGAVGCVGVVRTTDTGTSLLWTASLPSGDGTQASYVSNLAGSSSPELVAAFSEVVALPGGLTETRNSIRVFDAMTGSVLETIGPTTGFSSGFVWLANARIEGADVDSLVTSTPGGTRFIHRHSGTTFERGLSLGSLIIDRWPRLLDGVEIYNVPSGGRLEPLLVGSANNTAILARTSANEHRVIGLRRNDPTAGATTGVLAGMRRSGRGAFVLTLPAQIGQASLRKLSPSAQYDGRDYVGDGINPPLFLVSRPSYATNAFRQELRAARTSFARGETILSSNRASLIDATEATPYDVIPASVPNAQGCTENLGATVNAWTPLGDILYLPTANSPIDTGTRARFDGPTQQCARSQLFASQFLPAATTGAAFTGDFFRLPIVGMPAAQSALLAFMQRDVGTTRELYATVQSGADQNIPITFPTSLAASLPSLGAVNGTSFAAVVTTVGSGAAPPHELHAIVGERPLRLARSTITGPTQIQFASPAPILLPASDGQLLMVNNAPNTSSNSTYARPTVWRIASNGANYTAQLVAWTSNATAMDAQPAVVVRCGADQYRLVFRSRVVATDSEDARIEAWQFSRTVAAPTSTDYTMPMNMERAWQLCLDRAGPDYDCASPPPSPRNGRVTYSALAAAQNGSAPVAVISNSAGQTFAIEDACGAARVRWVHEEPRAAGAPSIIDSNGDGSGEVVILSSDGTYHAIAQGECDRAGDARCPLTRPVCDVAARTCVECLTNLDCTAIGRGTCDQERRSCIPCAAAGASCDVSGGTCADTIRGGVSVFVCSCGGPSDCQPGFSCARPEGADAGARGVCTSGCDPSAPRCPLGFYCASSGDAGLGQCVGACTSNEQCAASSPSRPVCALAGDAGARSCVECETSTQCATRDPSRPVCGANRCVQCTVAEASMCSRDGRGGRCLGEGRCGCESDSDCSIGRCDQRTRTCSNSADSGVTPPWADTGCACDTRSFAPNHGRARALAALALFAAAGVLSRRRRKHARALATSAAAIALVAGSRDAHAQAAQPEAQARAPRRAVQCGEDASVDLFAEAREQFDAGQTALLANDHTGAERALRAALALFESPNTYLLLGRALVGQGRLEDGYDAFETTVLLATRCSVRDSTERGRTRYMRSIEQGAAERAQLAPRVALFTAHFEAGTPAGATIQLGDRPPIALLADRTVAAPAGPAVPVLIRAPGYQDFRATVSLERGRVSTVEVTLQRIVERAQVIERTVEREMVAVRRVPAAFGVGLAIAGAGVAAATTGAVLFVMARGRYAALEQACTMSICPMDPSFVRATERGERLELAGQATLWAGVGVTVVGTIVTLIGMPRTEYVPAPRARRSARVWLAPSLGALALEGAF